MDLADKLVTAIQSCYVVCMHCG